MSLAIGHQSISTPCPDRYALTALTPWMHARLLWFSARDNRLGNFHSAVQLSQEAEKLRRELSERESASSQSERPKEGADRLEEREAAALERSKEGADRLQDQQSAGLDPQQSPFGYEVPPSGMKVLLACRDTVIVVAHQGVLLCFTHASRRCTKPCPPHAVKSARSSCSGGSWGGGLWSAGP